MRSLTRAMRLFKPLNGQREVTFVIRDEDRAGFDLTHLGSHSSVGLQTRLFYSVEDAFGHGVQGRADTPIPVSEGMAWV